MKKFTPHPDWVLALLAYLEPYKRRVVTHKIFTELARSELSMKRLQGALINFYPLIENFPKYMALNLTKVPAGGSSWGKRSRYWLIRNINQERLHTGWWKEFACGFGVPRGILDRDIHPPPEMDAINHYLWHVCTYGSLTEAVGAANYAVEGPTGEWTKSVRAGVEGYQDAGLAKGGEKTLEWVTAHASYDDRHPDEALEIIKAYAATEKEQEEVKYAAQRSMEYYALALDACYEIFK